MGKVSSFLGLAFQDSGPAVRSRISPPAAVGRLLRVSNLSHGPCHTYIPLESQDRVWWMQSQGRHAVGSFSFDFFFSRPCIRSPIVSPFFLRLHLLGSNCVQSFLCFAGFLASFFLLLHSFLCHILPFWVVYFLTFFPAPCG